MTDRPWTAGPWEINANPYGPCIAKGGKSFVAVWPESMDRTAFPSAANATLIAAAPDLYEALEQCMIGGNHLATVLIERLGPDFADRLPPGSTFEFVRSRVETQTCYDLWCCWNSLMIARAALAKANPSGGTDE